MGKINIRHNFETNSSSMHSLSIRADSCAYSAEELEYTEEIARKTSYDAIITLKEGAMLTPDEIRSKTHVYGDSINLWSHYMCFENAPMEVLGSFKEKLRYAIASVCSYKYRGWESRLEEIKDIFNKVLPGVKLNIDGLNRAYGRSTSVNDYILGTFLKSNKFSMEEFLTSSKYIVIVDYEEYKKMKFLNMINEDAIYDVFLSRKHEMSKMNIVDGVWKLSEIDINFGRSPFRVLGTPAGKARYALASENSRNIEEVTRILQEVYPELRKIELPKSWLSEYPDHEDEIDVGYCEDCAIPTSVSLRDFILNKKYVIISDGDEYCVWDRFKQTELFNKEMYPDERISDYDY